MRKCENSDLDEVLKISVHFNRHDVSERLSYGHQCYFVEENGIILFYGWIGINRVYAPITGKYISIPADTAYFYNTYTHPDFRDRMLIKHFISQAREYCIEHDLPFGFTLVDVDIGIPVRAYNKMVGAAKITLIEISRFCWFRKEHERVITLKEATSLSKQKRFRHTHRKTLWK